MSFDELIEIFDHACDKKGNIEIYVTSSNHIAFILPDDNEIWLSQEDAIKVFVLLGKALKSINKLEHMTISIDYKIT